MADIFTIEKPELELPKERDYSGSKPFSSRPFGIILMVILALSWVFNLLLPFIYWSSSIILDEGASAAALILLVITPLWLLLLLISSIAFLIWIYKVHQDLWFLFKGYPITPIGAIARFFIPIYSLYGVWEALDEMRRRFLPGFGKWIVAFYVLLIAQAAANIIASVEPLIIPQLLLLLISTTIYFVMTLKIHRGLAGRFIELAAADNESTGEAVDEIQENQVSTETLTAGFAASPVSEAQRRSRNRKWIIALLGILLSLCLISACALVTVGASNVLRWFDWNYWGYVLALDDHYALDDSVATFLVEISFIQNDSGESEVWLVINVETPMDCGARVADPCERLANEIAAFTLQNYARINEVDGLSMTVTTVHGDETDQTTIGLEKNMSIAEWREELRVSNKLDA